MLEIAGAFATYYLAFVLTEKDGPFSMFYKLREKSYMLQCLPCTSFWSAIPFALIVSGLKWETIVYIGAYASFATILWMVIDE